MRYMTIMIQKVKKKKLTISSSIWPNRFQTSTVTRHFLFVLIPLPSSIHFLFLIFSIVFRNRILISDLPASVWILDMNSGTLNSLQ